MMSGFDWKLLDQPSEIVAKERLLSIDEVQFELSTIYLKNSDMRVYGLRAFSGDNPFKPGYWSRIVGVYDSEAEAMRAHYEMGNA